jgi:hypothetical protein
MANNYTDFSVLIPAGDGKGEKVVEWVNQVTKEGDDYGGEWGGSVSFAADGDALWAYSDGGCADVDAAIALIQRFLRDFAIKGGVILSWADYCSKPRANEFSGGAALITRDNVVIEDPVERCKRLGSAALEYGVINW